MTLEELKKKRLELRKQNKSIQVKLLGTLIADLEYEAEKGKVIDASTITSKIKKYVKNAEDMIALSENNSELKDEVQFLSSLLPSMLSDEQIINFFTEQKVTNIGQAMQALKKEYAGQYDASNASKIAKEFLK